MGPEGGNGRSGFTWHTKTIKLNLRREGGYLCKYFRTTIPALPGNFSRGYKYALCNYGADNQLKFNFEADGGRRSMMDKDKLRKADIFSGGMIFLFGLWVISQGLKMPMKDSWGGVQNVWFVSPALFPLFVGAMIALLGAMLVRTALKEVGVAEFKKVLRWLISAELVRYLKTPPVIRLYAMAVLFVAYVFLNIPRIDFLLGSVLFLVAFISMFYFDDDALLKKFFYFYLTGTVVCLLYFTLEIPKTLETILPYPNDWLTFVFIIAYAAYAWALTRHSPPLRKKYRISLILAVIVPFIICPIFKYFLLVPMPKEGLVVAVMDAIWYWDF